MTASSVTLSLYYFFPVSHLACIFCTRYIITNAHSDSAPLAIYWLALYVYHLAMDDSITPSSRETEITAFDGSVIFPASEARRVLYFLEHRVSLTYICLHLGVTR
jgi:hypothetical protein